MKKMNFFMSEEPSVIIYKKKSRMPLKVHSKLNSLTVEDLKDKSKSSLYRNNVQGLILTNSLSQNFECYFDENPKKSSEAEEYLKISDNVKITSIKRKRRNKRSLSPIHLKYPKDQVLHFQENETYRDQTKIHSHLYKNQLHSNNENINLDHNYEIFRENHTSVQLRPEDVDTFVKFLLEYNISQTYKNKNKNETENQRVYKKLKEILFKEIGPNNFFEKVLENIKHKVEVRNSKNKLVTTEFIIKSINREIQNIKNKNNNSYLLKNPNINDNSKQGLPDFKKHLHYPNNENETKFDKRFEEKFDLEKNRVLVNNKWSFIEDAIDSEDEDSDANLPKDTQNSKSDIKKEQKNYINRRYLKTIKENKNSPLKQYFEIEKKEAIERVQLLNKNKSHKVILSPKKDFMDIKRFFENKDKNIVEEKFPNNLIKSSNSLKNITKKIQNNVKDPNSSSNFKSNNKEVTKIINITEDQVSEKNIQTLYKNDKRKLDIKYNIKEVNDVSNKQNKTENNSMVKIRKQEFISNKESLNNLTKLPKNIRKEEPKTKLEEEIKSNTNNLENKTTNLNTEVTVSDHKEKANISQEANETSQQTNIITSINTTKYDNRVKTVESLKDITESEEYSKMEEEEESFEEDEEICRPYITQSSKGFSIKTEEEMKKTFTNILEKLNKTAGKLFEKSEREEKLPNTILKEYVKNLKTVREKKEDISQTKIYNDSIERSEESKVVQEEKERNSKNEMKKMRTDVTKPTKQLQDITKISHFEIEPNKTDKKKKKIKKDHFTPIEIKEDHKVESIGKNVKKGDKKSNEIIRTSTISDSNNFRSKITNFSIEDKAKKDEIHSNKSSKKNLDSILRRTGRLESLKESFNKTKNSLMDTQTNLNKQRKGDSKKNTEINHQTKLLEKKEEIIDEGPKFKISLDFFKVKKTDPKIIAEKNSNSNRDKNKKGDIHRKDVKDTKPKAKLAFFDEVDEDNDHLGAERKISNNQAASDPQAKLVIEVTLQNEFEQFISNKFGNNKKEIENIVNNDKLDTKRKEEMLKNLMSRQKDKDPNGVLGLIEMINRQEEIKKKKAEERKKYTKKGFQKIRSKEGSKEYLSPPQKTHLDLQEELNYKKNSTILKYQLEKVFQPHDESLAEELKKKREQAMINYLDKDLNFILNKIQNDEESEKFKSLMNGMEKLKKFDMEQYIQNVVELYDNIAYEENSHQNILKREERLNTFLDILQDFRVKNKAIKSLMRSKNKTTDAVNPIITLQL